jgi:serine/threonine protein phosphatase PrpC
LLLYFIFIGDSVAQKLGVLTEPDIRVFDLTPNKTAYIVVASDGVWDGLTMEQVNEIVAEYYLRGMEDEGDVNNPAACFSPGSPTPPESKNTLVNGEMGNDDPTSPEPVPSVRESVTRKASRSITKKSLAGLDKASVDDNTTNIVVCVWWE